MIFHSFEIERATTYLTKQFERGKSVKVETVTKSRTLSQNAYAWLVFAHIAQETGNTKDEVYQFCLKNFPVHKEIVIGDKITLIDVGLSKMTKEQTSHFIDQFTIYFRSEGFSVPDPEDKRLNELYDEYKDRGWV
jgi:hypothetical protein